MEELGLYRQRLLERYAEVAAELGRFAARAQRDRWDRSECEGASLRQTFTHLRDVEAEYFQPVIRKLLDAEASAEGECRARAWQPPLSSRDEPPETILEDFQRLGRETAEALRELYPSAWSRLCRHPAWGERTLQWWVEQSLAHSAGHLQRLRDCFPELVV